MINSKSGLMFGLLSGFLWAIYLFILDKYYSTVVYSLFFSSIILFLLNELCAFFWLTLTYKGRNFSRLYTHKKMIGKRWWLFSISPIGILFYILAIIVSNSVTVSVVSSIYPILSVFLTRVILQRKITLFHYGLAILSFLGLFLFSLNTFSNVNANFYGIIFSLICAFCWAGESVLCRYYSEVNIATDILLSIKYVISIVIGIIIFLIYIIQSPLVNFLYIIEYSGLFFVSIISLLSYLFYYRAIANIGSVYALNLNITYVFWIMIFSAFSDEISIYSILGAITIITSIFLISIQKDHV